MEKWTVKRLIKIIIITGLVIWIIGLTGIIFFSDTANDMLKFYIDILSGNLKGNNTTKESVLKFSVVWLSSVIVLPTIIYVFFVGIKNKSEIPSKDIYRDFEEKYTPAMASFLIDRLAEKNKDILATILDLNVRGYISIKKDEEFEITVENKNIDNLFLHEKYVINQIKEKSYVNLNKFVKIVEEDCKKEGLLKEKEVKKIEIVYVLMFIICMVILQKPFHSNSDLMIKAITFIGAIFSFIMMVSRIMLSRTQKGKEAAIKFKGFKNYLKEYTLVKTRDVEYINVLDRYLTFALALGEADTIEKLYVPYNKLISKYIEGGK